MKTTVVPRASHALKETDTKSNAAASMKQRRLNRPRSETVRTNHRTRGITASNTHLPMTTSIHPLGRHPVSTYPSKTAPTTSRHRDTTIMTIIGVHHLPCTTTNRSTNTCVSEATTANRVRIWANIASQALYATNLTMTHTYTIGPHRGTTAAQKSTSTTRIGKEIDYRLGDPCTSLKLSRWILRPWASRSKLQRLRLVCRNRTGFQPGEDSVCAWTISQFFRDVNMLFWSVLRICNNILI